MSDGKHQPTPCIWPRCFCETRCPSHPEWLAGYRVGLELAAQMAFDQQTDHPEANGTWNDACEHISRLIKEGTPA